MSNDKHKNIPTLENVVKPGGSKSVDTAKKDSKNTAKAAEPTSKNKRESDDRRKKQTPIPEGQAERRGEPRRSVDQRRSAEMTQLVEKIMQDMMPDLEQHLTLQLRFELQKHMPKILSEFKDKDDE